MNEGAVMAKTWFAIDATIASTEWVFNAEAFLETPLDVLERRNNIGVRIYVALNLCRNIEEAESS